MEAVSDPDSSVDLLAPCLLGRGLTGALGNFLLNLSTIVFDFVTYFRNMQLCFANSGNPTSWWNLRRGLSTGLLKFHTRHDFSELTIVEMHFLGTPLGCWQSMFEDVDGGRLGWGCGIPVGG